jgi:hypothetical protein
LVVLTVCPPRLASCRGDVVFSVAAFASVGQFFGQLFHVDNSLDMLEQFFSLLRGVLASDCCQFM